MLSYDISLFVSSLNMLISRSIHIAANDIFHFLWLIFHYIFYDMWTLDSGLTDVRDSPVSMNVLS